MTRKSFPHRLERATYLLGIIHTNVCGLIRLVSRQGISYFITFTDDYSRYGYVYLLKHKHEVFETFKVFKNEVENQLEKKIKALRSDRGGEYISQEFKDYLEACEIVQQLTPPYTPQHNGMSERRNQSATHILNMVPTKKVDKTPYELWYGKVLNLSYLKVWGCEALVKWDTPDKLQQRSVKCIFIRYPKEMMGYYFYFPPENKIVVARYPEFFKKNLITQEVSGRAIDLEEIQDEDTSPSEITSEIPIEVEGFEPPQKEVILIRRSKRIHLAPNRLCLNIEVEEHSPGDLNEPASYKAVMLDSESNKIESSCSITSSSNLEIVALKAEMAEINKNLMKVLQINQQLKAVTHSCETCGGPYSYNYFPATVGQTQNSLSAAPAADSNEQVLAEWNALYDAYNEVAYLMLDSMTPEIHRQFENYSPYEMIQELKSMFEKQDRMKGYVDQLERLGYMLPQDLIVGLILNGLTKDFTRFVRNYNMHNMGKTIGELHVMLIKYEKGLPKKAETPQVMMIKGGKIQKAKKKSLIAKGKGKANGKRNDKQVYIPKPKNPKPAAKEHPAKDDTCHHCKEVDH
nr:hypothetical protein [Tanacetum cinerariifolium]